MQSPFGGPSVNPPMFADENPFQKDIEMLDVERRVFLDSLQTSNSPSTIQPSTQSRGKKRCYSEREDDSAYSPFTQDTAYFPPASFPYNDRFN